jgi:hypothetical protein
MPIFSIYYACNFHHDSSTTASKRCRCRYRHGQNGYGHDHTAPLCWTPQTTARSFPLPPHSPSTHLYTPERRDTSFFYIACVHVQHRQSKCLGHHRCPRPFLLFFAWLNASSSYLSNASGLASCSSLWTSISSRHPAGHLLRAITVLLHLKI